MMNSGLELVESLQQFIQDKHNLKGSIATYSKYLELFESIDVKLRQMTDMAVLDQILRKFFSNFTIHATGKGKQQKCDITHKFNEPWDGFVKLKDFDCGRRTGTSNEPIFAVLHSFLLNYSTIKDKLDRLHLLVNDFTYSEKASKMQFLL